MSTHFSPPEMMAFGAPVLQTIHCENMLGDYVGDAITKDPTPYDVAIVDLMFNECGLALAHRLGAPAVGYWAFSFSSGWQVTNLNMWSYVSKCVCQKEIGPYLGPTRTREDADFLVGICRMSILRSSHRNQHLPPLSPPSCLVLEAG